MRRGSVATVIMLLFTVMKYTVWGTEPARRYSLKNVFGLALSVEPKTGQYFVSYDGDSWFGPGIVSVLADKRWYRNARVFGTAVDKKLVVETMKTGSQADELGHYQFIDLDWRLEGTDKEFITSFHLYQDRPYLIFVQKFPQGFKNYASGDWTVPSVAFPQFTSQNMGSRKDLYLWSSGGMLTHRLAYGDAYTIQGTVDVLLLADRSYNSLVLSPFSHYLVATQQSEPLAAEDQLSRGSIRCGVEGLVDSIPRGFEQSTILVAGRGIHNTFEKWGRALMTKAGKKFPSKYQDDTLKYPVYMDDAGAYYYEHNFKEAGYNSYEDIILGVENDARKHGLRIGAYHVVDLFQQQYQDGLFEPRRDLFPHGLRWLHEQLGKPLQLYVTWLDPKSPYAERYPFYPTEPGPVPGVSMGDVFYSLDYWRYTADKIVDWGGVLLQHDFLTEYEGNRAMMSDVSKMDTFFKNMAKALGEKGIDMQYCMQAPRNILESTENPIMVSLQGSDDHHVPMSETKPYREETLDPYDWKHLIFTDALYGALGIWPSRDNIQTIADPNAEEDILLANLLGGSVQLGHRMGQCDFDLVAKTYREGDGLVLKPDRPIVPLDRSYVTGAAVGYTQSTIGGHSWFYVLSLPSAGYFPAFTPSDLGISGASVVYNYDTRSAFIRHSDSRIDLAEEPKHQYFIVAPLVGGLAVLGDTSKFVTMADMRIASVKGGVGESLEVGVIANHARSPIITGYALHRPTRVTSVDRDLEEMSSLNRLAGAPKGWYWDHETKLWYVKIDFTNAVQMQTRYFAIR